VKILAVALGLFGFFLFFAERAEASHVQPAAPTESKAVVARSARPSATRGVQEWKARIRPTKWVSAVEREIDVMGRVILEVASALGNGFRGVTEDGLALARVSADQTRGLMLCVRRHLRPGGLFAFDVNNPRPDVLRRKRPYPVWRYRSPRGPVEVWVRNGWSGRGINHVRFEHRREGATIFEEEMALRCFFPGEIQGLLEGNGFDIERWYGGFDRRPFRPDSPLQVVLARLRL